MNVYLKEIEFKNFVSYYFDDVSNGTTINFSHILSNKKLYGIFQFIIFHIKL